MTTFSKVTLIFFLFWSFIAIMDYMYNNVRIENKLLGAVYIGGLIMCVSLAVLLGDCI